MSGRRERTGTVLVANPSADLYGSDRMIVEAIRSLVAVDRRVVFTSSVDGPLLPLVSAAGAETRVLPVPIVRRSMLTPRGLVATIATIARSWPRMRRLIREVDPDVVIGNTLTIPFWTLAARVRRRPALVYVHEAEAGLPWAARTMLTAPLGAATGAVFNSKTSRDVCRPRGLSRRGRVRVVPNGVTGPDEVAPPRQRIDGPFRLLYVGRLSPRKGVDLVLRAVALLRDHGVDVAADVVGDVFPGYEWYEEELRTLAHDLDIADQIRFQGFQPVVWDAISAADAVIVPSRADESFGNVVVEALRCSRPVVLADHSGLHEAGEGFSAVIRVPVDDAPAIAEAVRRLMDEWPAYAAAARTDAAQAAERFGVEHYRSRFVAAVDELSDSPRGAQIT
ncbi:glycosyltransferase [Microbacterium sp. NPDC057659]|uniref:glycosyltransferase n=1 Tax=Microbacterium sp. NPDC057659 TaxID=3346198 RepID=UPI0036700E8C